MNESSYEHALLLVVERDPHVRRLERYFLEEAGFAVQFADDGEQALEHARRMRPAIMISEILVPRLDGLSVCRALKATPETAAIPVLLFSVLAAAARAKDAGADAFIKKPLDEKIFLGTVRDLLARRQTGGQA